jgi:hypothetical protein
VTSTLYPSDGSFHGSVGKTGDFKINPPSTNAADVDHYVYALTPLTTPPTDGTRTVAASPTDHSATVRLTPTVSGLNELRVWSVDKAGNTSPLASPLVYQFRVDDPSSPIGIWVGDDPAGATALVDSSGYGHDAVATNVTLGAPGQVVDGLTAPSFNGSVGTGAVPGHILDTSQSFTVSAWVQLNDTSTYHTALAQDGTHTTAFQLQWTPGCGWRFVMLDSDVPAPTGPSFCGPVAQARVWTHLAGVYDSGARTLSLYVNGVRIGTSPAPVAPWNAAGTLTIGRTKWNDGTSDFWTGRIADVRVWDRVVYPDELAALAGTLAGSWSLDGFGADDTGRHDATATNVSWTVDRFGNPGAAASFNATSSVLTTASAALNTDQSFTVSAWVRLTDNSTYRTAVSQDGVHNTPFQLQLSASCRCWAFKLQSADVPLPTQYIAQAASAAQLNTWTHLVGVYDATRQTMALYVNGVLAASASAPLVPWQAGGALTIGRTRWNDGYTDYWAGSVDEVKVLQGALPASAVANL